MNKKQTAQQLIDAISVTDNSRDIVTMKKEILVLREDVLKIRVDISMVKKAIYYVAGVITIQLIKNLIGGLG